MTKLINYLRRTDMTNPNGWEEKIVDCFGGEKWNASVILMEFPEVLDNLNNLLHQAILSAEENLLKEIMEEMQKQEIVMTVNRIGLDGKRTENKLVSLDQVNTMLERKLSTVKKI